MLRATKSKTSLKKQAAIHNKLVTLIGDLDKLAENKDVRREYLTNLSQVNFFMDKK